MNVQEFREFSNTAIDYLADYFETIRDRPVLPSVKPGYLENLLPEEAPANGESWINILQDVEDVITPGLSHWHSPYFHAYYPTANSYPGIVAEILLSGLGIISTDWSTGPACVELEVKMMDWLGKLIGLPENFLNCSEGPGGGVIQNAASESTLVGLLTAKLQKIQELLQADPTKTQKEIERKLIAYTSEQSNSSVEKAGLLASVEMKLLPTDSDGSLRGSTLLAAIQQDLSQDRIPCCLVATLGTTGTCSFDNLVELGPICQQYKLWLHVDAAYAGAAFVCPEYRHLMAGIEHVDSFNFNPHKWMLVNSDCSAMWFRDTKRVEQIFKLDSNKSISKNIPEIQHWQIPDRRRFRALKLWFVLRSYGVEGIRKYIRDQISLAKYFEQLVRNDDRFEVCTSSMGLVCVRLKGEDELTQKVLNKIAQRKKLFIMPYYYRGKLVIRFVICSRFTVQDDIIFAWNEIKEQTDEIFKSLKLNGRK